MSDEITLKTASVEVGDATFTTTQFPSLHGLEVMTRLIKVLGPTIATLLGADQSGSLVDLAPKLQVAMSTVEPSVFRKLVVDMLASTTVIADGKIMTLSDEKKIDRVFAGNLAGLFKVFGHAVEVNFSDFFAEMLRAQAEVTPPPRAPSE